MKQRSDRFLSEENIPHDSEQFDYIRELHDYLWRFVRASIPGASGDIGDYIDAAVKMAENGITEKDIHETRITNETVG